MLNIDEIRDKCELFSMLDVGTVKLLIEEVTRWRAQCVQFKCFVEGIEEFRTEDEINEMLLTDEVEIKRLRDENEKLKLSLNAWEESAQHGHPSPCNMGPLCPYCEIENLVAENEKLQELLLGRE